MRDSERQTSNPKSKIPEHEEHKTLSAGASGEEPGSVAGSHVRVSTLILGFRPVGFQIP